jgi:AbiV family abortive infection protein
MPSGRHLYRLVSAAAAANARQLIRDARNLKSIGSRGHACSLAILSIEESAKALVYYTASEGVYRLVEKNPNYVTTYRKKDLLDHRFKHAIVSAFLADWMFYLPFYSILEGKRKDTFRRSEVEQLLQKAIHSHRRHRIELSSGGKATQELNKMFSLLESLNDKKNRGLYVDHTDCAVLRPNGLSAKETQHVLSIAEMVTQMVSEIVRVSIAPEQKRILVDEARRLAQQLKRLKSHTEKESSK